MVSGSKITSCAFSEGEKVLCYEPDPSKAKVLYESKILEIRLPNSQTKVSTGEGSTDEASTKETLRSESRGPSPDEKDSIAKDESDSNHSSSKARYLVHFSGWNSSWDRVVDEERILKDTPANRALQRSLAEEAATLLSKSRNRNRSKIPPMIKEVINSTSSQDGSYSVEFTADDFDLAPVASDADEDESSASGSLTASIEKASNLASDKSLVCDKNSASEKCLGSEKCLAVKDTNQSVKEDVSTVQWIPMPNELKELIDMDEELIKNKKKVYKLPMRPCICEILQSFIHTVMNQNPSQLFPNINTKRSGVTRSSINSVSRLHQDLQQLVPEFANSIHIYVNAIAQTHLFYSDIEKEHFLKVLNQDTHMESESDAKDLEKAKEELRDRPKSWRPSNILGFIHLLRFLVILPDFVKATPSMTRAHAHQIMFIIEPFYHYLCNKIHAFHSIE